MSTPRFDPTRGRQPATAATFRRLNAPESFEFRGEYVVGIATRGTDIISASLGLQHLLPEHRVSQSPATYVVQRTFDASLTLVRSDALTMVDPDP